MSMRLRLLALALIAVFVARVAPCDAGQPGRMAADCCDEGFCPDAFSNAGPHDMAATGEPCCALAAQHHQQSHAQLASAQVVLAPPVQVLEAGSPWSLAAEFDRSDHSVAVARSAPLYVLFSVCLV
jgi:hypothetical protein